MSDARVLYRLHPRQREAMELLGFTRLAEAVGQSAPAPVEQLLFGGGVAGGKSLLLRAVGVQLCLAWPGARVPLFRRTYPELEDSHIPSIQAEVQPPIAQYSVGRRELHFGNGSVLLFRHCEHESQVYAYNTAEFAALLVDQAEGFSAFMLQFLLTRVRQPVGAFGGRWRPVVVLSANPGGISHQYLREEFVEAAAAGVPFVSASGIRRCYLPARLADNPSIDAEQYRRGLRDLPEHLQRAYLEGDWSAVVGAYFTAWRGRDLDGQPWHEWPLAFARQRYGLKESDPFPPADWVRWCGIDLGVRDPFCCLWLCRAPDGRIVVYRERYGAGVPVPQQARLILSACREAGERPAQFVADPAGFAARANLSVSDAEVYAQQGVPLVRGNNRREQGWRRVGELLTQTLDDGYPQLVVLERAAPNLVRTLPVLLADPLRPEDVDQGQSNHAISHAADALRYAVTPAMVAPVVRIGLPIQPVDGDGEDEFEPDNREYGFVGPTAAIQPAMVVTRWEWRDGQRVRVPVPGPLPSPEADELVPVGSD